MMFSEETLNSTFSRQNFCYCSWRNELNKTCVYQQRSESCSKLVKWTNYRFSFVDFLEIVFVSYLPWVVLVDKTLYGVSFKSRFSFLSSLSIKVIICNINWSWRKSSPCLKIAMYGSPDVVRNVSLHGIWLDLKRVALNTQKRKIRQSSRAYVLI